MEKYEEKDGVWRTIRGRKVFIRDGESLGSAMARSGKFKNLTRSKIRETKDQLRQEDRLNKSHKYWEQEHKETGRKNFNKERYENYKRKSEKEYNKTRAKDSDEIEYRGAEQAEKNRIDEERGQWEDGKTRVGRNSIKYSLEQQRELRHEYLQKKLADYKAKKQSNVRDYKAIEKREKEINDKQREKELYEKAINFEKQSNNKIEGKEYKDPVLHALNLKEAKTEYDKMSIEYKNTLDKMAEYNTERKKLYEGFGTTDSETDEKARKKLSPEKYKKWKELTDKYNEERKKLNTVDDKIKEYVNKKQSNNKVEDYATYNQKQYEKDPKAYESKLYDERRKDLNKHKGRTSPYDDPESEESQRMLSIQSRYDEYLQDTENRGASYGELAYIQGLRGKKLDDFEKELDKKASEQETKWENFEINGANNIRGMYNKETKEVIYTTGKGANIQQYKTTLDKLKKEDFPYTHEGLVRNHLENIAQSNNKVENKAKKQETIKNYVEKKQSNNKVITQNDREFIDFWKRASNKKTKRTIKGW